MAGETLMELEVPLVPIRLADDRLIRLYMIDGQNDIVYILELGNVFVSVRGPAGSEGHQLLVRARELLEHVISEWGPGSEED